MRYFHYWDPIGKGIFRIVTCKTPKTYNEKGWVVRKLNMETGKFEIPADCEIQWGELKKLMLLGSTDVERLY